MNKFWQSAGGAAVISGAGALGSGLFGGLFSKGAQRRQYKYNLKLQQQQQDWQKMMWDLENKYNLPINEVRRLIDAGVNPALAFSNAGGGAAPVPIPGSSGGVSAPTADFPNVGAAAVQSAQNQQRLDNETKVADSQAALNKAKADAARKSAGLMDVKKNYLDFQFGVDKELRDILVGKPRLSYQFDQLNYALGYQKYVQGEIYTRNYPTILGQRMETDRLNINLLRHSSNRILAEIDLLKAQKGLTDEQAKIARERVVCATFDAMMARVSMEAYDKAFRTVYDPKTGEARNIMDQFTDAIRNQVTERLVRSETGLLEAGLDSSFQSQYGESLRFYNYETVRRGANKLRTDQYVGVVSSILSLGSAVMGGMNVGSQIGLRKQLQRRWNSMGREFGVPSSSTVSPYGRFPDATAPSYYGGEDYYPLYDF